MPRARSGLAPAEERCSCRNPPIRRRRPVGPGPDAGTSAEPMRRGFWRAPGLAQIARCLFSVAKLSGWVCRPFGCLRGPGGAPSGPPPQVARVPVRARGLSGPAGKPPSQSHISSTWSSPGGGCPGGAGASVVLLPTFTQRKRPNGEGWGEPEISSGGDPLGVRLAERREVFDAHKGLIF